MEDGWCTPEEEAEYARGWRERRSREHDPAYRRQRRRERADMEKFRRGGPEKKMQDAQEFLDSI